MESLELRVIEGADAGMRVAIGEGGFIGRSAACRFRLSDPSVQPMHARIRIAGDGYVLTDVSEGVGLQVNDQPVKSRPLQANDRIRLGAVVLDIAVSAQAAGAAGRPVPGRVVLKGSAPSSGAPAAGPAPADARPESREQTGAHAPESRTPVWIVSGVIALIVVAVVVGLWLHLLSLRKDVERRYREAAELAKSGRATSSQALDRYRGILKEAEEVHPKMADRLKAMIRTIEADMSAALERERAALRELDAKANELADRGDYSLAVDVYRNAGASLKKIVEESRTARVAELERLAAEKVVKQGKTE